MIYIAERGTVRIYTATGAGAPGAGYLEEYLRHHYLDDNGDDESAGVALSQRFGYGVVVETVEGAFELRKLQVRWNRSSGAAGGADDAVTTHHFLYAPGGTPTDVWAAGQFTAVENAFNTFWTAWKSYVPANYGLKQYRWYKAGPAVEPPQLPVRIVDVNAQATGQTTPQLPPQVAVSITEKTTDPKSWGRFYMLSPNATNGGNASGRLITATQTALANLVDAMYESWQSAGTIPVVYSSPKPSRTTKAGTTLAARDGRALPVKSIQIDDVFDVIRSRRWNEPLLREQRDIAGS